MRQRGQTTSFQTRLEMSEQAEARLERPTNRNQRRLLSLDCAEVATTIAPSGTCRLHLSDGTACHWSCEYLPHRIKGDHSSSAPAPSRLGTRQPFSCAEARILTFTINHSPVEHK